MRAMKAGAHSVLRRVFRWAMITCMVVAPYATLARSTMGRAVSLKALQTVLKSGPSEEADRLCGITRVIGFVEDAKSHDLILIGAADPDLPPLHLDDFVVALRNVWLVYAIPVRNAGQNRAARCYEPPGCSIDPDAATLRKLQEIGDRLSACTENSAIDDCLHDWQEVGRQPQNVRVTAAKSRAQERPRRTPARVLSVSSGLGSGTASSAQTGGLRRAVLEARKSLGTLSWDFPLTER